MMNSLLPWRIQAAVLACLSGTLVACSSGAPSEPILVSLRIFPANPVVRVGASTPLTATGIFSDSSRQDLTESVTWSSSAPQIVDISDAAGSRGLVTGVAFGTATLRAVHPASMQAAEALAAVPFPPPELSAVQPAKGPRTGGTPITLSGKWFEPGISVTIGGAPVTGLRIVNATTATAVTPPGVGPQDVVVTGALGSATLPGGFTYRVAPTLTRVQPSSGPVYGGTVITLQGTDLTPDTLVTVGGAPLLNLTSIDDTTMTGTTPAGTVGLKELVVTNSLGSAMLSGSFTYVDPWRPSRTGMDGGYVTALVGHPSNSSILYAGTLGGGVFKSTNAGQSWTPINQGLRILIIRGLVIEPLSPDTLYVATDRGLFKSTDGGESWFSPSSTLEQELITALTLVPASPATLYAAVSAEGILKSSDGGVTWNAINTGLGLPVIRSLEVDPTRIQFVYAGSTHGAIFKTSNGGQSWFPARAGIPNTAGDILDLVIDPVTPDTLYAATSEGVYASIDGGANWTSASTGLGNRSVLSLLLVTGTPATLYAGTAGGLFKSTTGGSSWSSASTGLPPLPIKSLWGDWSNRSILYAGTQDGGVFKTADDAASWAPSKRGMINVEVFSIRFSLSAPDVAYAGAGAGVFKTVDAGESWTDVGLGLANRQVHATAVHPTDPAIAYAGTVEGLYKTVNGGESWLRVLSESLSRFNAVAVHPTTPETVYAGSSQSLFKSVNGGASWTQLTQGLPSPLGVTSIVLSPQTPSTVFMATPSTVYRSTDDGAQWVDIGAGLPQVSGGKQLWVAPGPVETIYVISLLQGLYKTVNGGANWEQLFSSNAKTLAIHPQDPQMLYLGQYGGDSPLLLSRDGGRSWAPVSLPFLSIMNVLAMKPGDPRTILAGTRTLGVFKTTTGGL